LAKLTKQANPATDNPKPLRKARKRRKTRRAKHTAQNNPLPPPLAVVSEPGNPNPAPFEVSQVDSSTGSIANGEPQPGEPLDAGAESILGALPDFIGDETQPDGTSAAHLGDDPGSSPMLAPNAPGIQFDPEYVRAVLEESFSWVADRFDSAHWLLTERQSKMLTGPTTQLMGSLWTRVQQLLPEWLARWSSETPGLVDCVFAFSLVLGPKIGQQVAISRVRRAKAARAANTPRQSAPGPVAGVGPVAGAVTEVFSVNDNVPRECGGG
jgi:hypothetical protein